MKEKIEILQLQMVVNGSAAQKELITLEMSTKDLRKANVDLKEELKALSRAKTLDIEKYKQLSAEIEKNNNTIKQNDARMKELRNEIGITGLTMNQLKQRARELRVQIDNMTPGNPNRKKLVDELEQINAQMGKLKTGAAQSKFSLSGMADGFNRYFGMVTALFASLTGLVLGFRKLVDMSNQYGESVANLSALTGLAGEDLNWLSDQAKNLAKNGTDSGIKITASAQSIVDSYTKMGSAKPELLKNKEALDQVTQQALVLAEAAKMEAAPAVEGLATVMNQFGAPASEAAKYVNVLAAGSKEGAAEITDIQDSIVKFGAAANSANVNVEQSVALIETLSEKGIKGEIAGTALKTMLVRLQKGADEFNPAIVGMSKALENLGKANLSTAEMADMFGTESLVQAQIVIENRKRFEELTTAVTGTDVAMQQAKVNTETNAAALKRAQSSFQLIAMDLGEKLAPALTFSTSGFSYLLKFIMFTIDAFKKYGMILLPVIAYTITYTAVTYALVTAQKIKTAWQQKENAETKLGIAITKLKVFWDKLAFASSQLLAAAQMALTGNIKGAAQAMRVFINVTKLNPYVALASVIMAVVAGLYLLSQRQDAVAKTQMMLNELNTKAMQNTVEEKTRLEQLISIANDRNKSLSERKAAIEAINKISPEFLGNLTLETIGTKAGKKAIDDYIKSLEKMALVQAAKEKLVEIEKEHIEAVQTGSKYEVGFWQGAWNSISTFGNMTAAAMKDYKTAVENGIDADKEYMAKKKALLGIIGDETVANITSNKATETETESKIRSVDVIEKEISALQQKQKEQSTTAAQWKKYDAEIKKLEAERDAITGGKSGKKDKFEYETDHLKELLATYQKFHRDILQDEQDSDLQQLQAIDDKYLDLRTASEKYYADEDVKLKKALEDKKITQTEFWHLEAQNVLAFQKEQDVIRRMRSDEQLAYTQKLLKKELDEEKKAKLAHEKELEQKIKDIIGISIQERIRLKKEEYAEYIKYAKEHGLDVKKLQEKLDEELKALQEELKKNKKDPIFGMDENAWKKLEEKFDKIAEKIKALGGVWQDYAHLKDTQADADISREEKANDKKKTALKQQLNDKYISEEEYNQQVQALDDKLEKKKAEADLEKAKRDRATSLFNIAIDTASAIMKSIAASPVSFGLPFSAFALASGALQTAAVLATPLPQAYDGTYEQVVGAQDGRTYNAKRGYGSGYFSTPTIHNNNKLVAERGPELVFSAPDTRRILNTPGLIKAINYSIGRLPQYADGNYDRLAGGNSLYAMERQIRRLNDMLDNGIQANLVANDAYVKTHKSSVRNVEKIQSQTSA